ncbi:MAG: sulfatase-like hydrolase/transferase [Planctomycetota bacterium]
MGSFIEPHHQNDVDGYSAADGVAEQYTGPWTPPGLAALPTFAESRHAQSLRVGGNAAGHRAGYFGMVRRLDDALGRVYDGLRSMDLLDDTILLFTSDHGCHFKTRNHDHKRSCHETSIRVPTMLHSGPFRGGGQIQEMISLPDLSATLIDACGLDVPGTM